MTIIPPKSEREARRAIVAEIQRLLDDNALSVRSEEGHDHTAHTVELSPNWDIIELSFGEPSGTNGTIAFTPDAATSQAEIISDVAILHSRGKKVLL